MDINFPYGDHKLTLTINEKNLLTVVNREEKEELKNPAETVLKTLREPIASPPLKDLVKKGDEVAIIVDDNTRPCPDPTILPPLLDELKGSGLNKNDVKIIVAYGLHPPLNKNGLIDLLGKEIIEKYQVINHDPEQVVQLGKTSRGVPIEINEHAVQADFLISTGLIEPHYFAGFSGGRKSIMPGVSGRNAIYKNHYFKLKGDPHTIAGKLEKNPIHQDAVEHAKAAHLDFIINILLNQKKEIIKVVSGDPIKAHLKGVRLERELVCKQVDQKADITITTNSGVPLDLNLYQSVKGISTASLVTKKGGSYFSHQNVRMELGQIYSKDGTRKQAHRKRF